MYRHFLSVGATMMALSTFASVPAANIGTSLRIADISAETAGELYSNSEIIVAPKVADHVRNLNVSQLAKAPMTEAPEGTVTNLTRNSMAYWVTWGMIGFANEKGSAMRLVETEDGQYYISNPVSLFENRSIWVKAEKDAEGNLTIPGKQLVMEDEYQGLVDEYYFMALRLQEDEKGKTFVPADENDIRFTLKDGVYVQENPEIMMGICLYYEEEYFWIGFGDLNNEISVLEDTLTVLPDGLTYEPWALVMDSGEGGYFVNVAFDNDRIYIQGLAENFRKAWAPGTIDGELVTLDEGIFLGSDDYTWAFLYGGAITQMVEPETGIYYNQAEIDGGMQFDYDAAAKKLTPRNMLIETSYKGNDFNSGDVIYYIGEFTISRQDRNPSTPPAEPMELYAMQESADSGFFSFTIPPLDADNNLIDTDNLYYRIYADDRLVTFSPDWYFGLEEETTLVPWNLALEDYSIDAYGPQHSIQYFFKAFNIGVQSVYMQTGENGETVELTSPIVSIEVEQTGIKGLEADQEVVSTTYFDLQGRVITEPVKGICIRRDVLKDGSSRSIKHVK